MKRLFTSALVLAAMGCAAATEETATLGASDVNLTARVAAVQSGGDSIVVVAHNHTTGVVYLKRCGSRPLLLTQQFVNGEWQGGVQNFLCPVPNGPDPMPVSPGDSVVTPVFESAGTFRFIVIAGTTSDLADGGQRFSNSIVVAQR